jgi:hypothetical protein
VNDMMPVSPEMNRADELANQEPCLMCGLFIDWLREAWPADKLEELPAFVPRPAAPILKIHGEQADYMPFCEACSRWYMQAMSQFHRERLKREGQEVTDLKARVEQKLVAPVKQIVLPGMPGFRAPA